MACFSLQTITDVEPVAGRAMPPFGISWERHHIGLHPQSTTALLPGPPLGLPLQPNTSLALQPTSSALEPLPISTAMVLQNQPLASGVGTQLVSSAGPQGLLGDDSLGLQPLASADSSPAGSRALPLTSPNMAVHASRMRALRQMATFPQPSGNQQDLISLTDSPVLGLVPESDGVQTPAVEASPVSFAGMDLGPGAVVHDNPLSTIDLSPTPILSRLTIPGNPGSAAKLPVQVSA